MNQEEHIGKGSLKKLPEIIKRFGSKKIFLVTGKKSFESLNGKEIIDSLKENYEITHFNDFSVNPNIYDVKKGIEVLKENKCDLVVAIGGGSVIDMAKSINILANQDDEIEKYITDEKEITKKGNNLIAIPTTSGSGSEATHFAVIYIDKKKFSLSHEFILPICSIVDSELTKNLPKEIAASSGMDALCQSIESYWAVNSSDISKEYARDAIKLIIENLENYVNENNEENREIMAKASHLAGKAINISKTTAAHAISYGFTSYLGIQHGHAVSLTLPYFIKFNNEISEESNNDKRGVEYVKNTMKELFDLLSVKTSMEAQKKIINLMQRIGLKTELSESADKINLILNSVSLERLENNPRKVKREDLMEILKNIL
ncbi:phosphonoacetaldehyde reductase [Candidatus Woesearchaeota archaeon]|nr:phosphonoacetaldehyde reductase [Candidatus Woesearchaeota archaeon]